MTRPMIVVLRSASNLNCGARRALARVDWERLPPCLSRNVVTILQRFRHGAPYGDIANEVGCSKQAIAKQLRNGILTIHAAQHPDHVLHCQVCNRKKVAE